MFIFVSSIRVAGDFYRILYYISYLKGDFLTFTHPYLVYQKNYMRQMNSSQPHM